MAKPTAIVPVSATPTIDAAEAEKAAKSKRVQEAELAALQSFQTFHTKGIEALKLAKEAKKDDFQKQETDFWKPEKAGESLQGVYLGFIPDRYITHLVGTLDKKGNPLMMRVKGTKQLTSALSRVKKGTGVRIEFDGTEKVENGTMRKFVVSLLDVGMSDVAEDGATS